MELATGAIISFLIIALVPLAFLAKFRNEQLGYVRQYHDSFFEEGEQIAADPTAASEYGKLVAFLALEINSAKFIWWLVREGFNGGYRQTMVFPPDLSRTLLKTCCQSRNIPVQESPFPRACGAFVMATSYRSLIFGVIVRRWLFVRLSRTDAPDGIRAIDYKNAVRLVVQYAQHSGLWTERSNARVSPKFERRFSADLLVKPAKAA